MITRVKWTAMVLGGFVLGVIVMLLGAGVSFAMAYSAAAFGEAVAFWIVLVVGMIVSATVGIGLMVLVVRAAKRFACPNYDDLFTGG